MYIAKQKREENIAEYILYLWQLEDLLRALQFSPQAIYTTLVAPHKADEQTARTLLDWYLDIAEVLRNENKEQSGHMEHTMHLIADLNNFHEQLLKLPTGKEYREQFAHLQPYLPQLRATLQNEEASDIELCFRALYAVVLYRIKGDTTHAKTIEDVITLISPVMATLAELFRQAETGEKDIYDIDSK